MFENMSLRAKIMGGSCVPLVLFVVLGVLSTRSINSLKESSDWVVHTHAVIAAAEGILASAVDMETAMRGYLLAGKDELLAPYKRGQTEFAEGVAALQKTVDDNPAQVKLLGQAQTTINEWQQEVTEPTIALRRQIGEAKTMDHMADRIPEARGKVYFDKFREQIATFTGREQKLMSQRQEDAAATAATSKMVIIAGTATAILLALIISALRTRAVVGPFKRIFAGLKKLSSGELGQTEQTFNRIIDGMTENVSQLANGSAQVSSSSQQLAAGASEQAASLEEVSSSLEQMAAMTRTSAENAKKANELSEQARHAAQSGEQTTQQLNLSMVAINESSSQISKIIKVIEEIAFQTNLLALNAAVEAARAGEHGKGFAVVAEEVRNLAGRAGDAAKEITDLIADSVSKAKEGTQVAGEVGTSLAAIVADITEVTELINGIAEASKEQSQGVDQINAAVSQMDKLTQQNAAGAEESAAAAEEMATQALAAHSLVEELVQMVKGTTSGGASAAWPTTSAAPWKPQRPKVTVGHVAPAQHGQQKANAVNDVREPDLAAVGTPDGATPSDDAIYSGDSGGLSSF